MQEVQLGPQGPTIAGAMAATNSLGFVHAFVSSLSMIIVSELGDKTFFIAAIMAMRHPRLTVFSGAMTALAFMTVLSGNYDFLMSMYDQKTRKSLEVIFSAFVSTGWAICRKKFDACTPCLNVN